MVAEIAARYGAIAPKGLKISKVPQGTSAHPGYIWCHEARNLIPVDPDHSRRMFNPNLRRRGGKPVNPAVDTRRAAVAAAHAQGHSVRRMHADGIGSQDLIRADLRALGLRPIRDPHPHRAEADALARRAVALATEGLTLGEIEAQIGRSKRWLQMVFKETGVRVEKAKYPAHRRSAGLRTVPERFVHRAAVLRGEGLTLAEIAAALGVKRDVAAACLAADDAGQPGDNPLAPLDQAALARLEKACAPRCVKVLVHHVAAQRGIDPDVILSPDRRARPSDARRWVSYVMRAAGFSIEVIGAAAGWNSGTVSRGAAVERKMREAGRPPEGDTMIEGAR